MFWCTYDTMFKKKKYFKANVTYNVIARAKIHMLNKIDYYINS